MVTTNLIIREQLYYHCFYGTIISTCAQLVTKIKNYFLKYLNSFSINSVYRGDVSIIIFFIMVNHLVCNSILSLYCACIWTSKILFQTHFQMFEAILFIKITMIYSLISNQNLKLKNYCLCFLFSG